MAKDVTLPPLPSSDAESLQRNRYHGFYKVGSREFWGEAEVSQNELKDFEKCQKHYFTKTGDEVRCSQCHVGWTVPAEIEVRDGKLFFRGEEQVAH